MNLMSRVIAIPAALLVSVGHAAAADEKPFSLNIGGGVEYDDNITVEETDVTTNQGDEALVVEGGASFRLGHDESLKFEAGYDFYQTLHEDLTGFDLQVHGLHAMLGTSIGGADAALDYRFSYITLGGDGLIAIHSVRPNVGFLVANKLYTMLAYEYQDRDNKLNNTRDAEQHAGSIAGYYVLSGGRTLNAGYKLVREEAFGPEFTYWGHVFDAGFKTPLSSGDWKPVWQIQYRYTRKDFSNVTPLIGVERRDRRHMARTSVTVPLFENLSFKAQYEYLDQASNLAAVDYADHIATGTFRWEM